jgi:hypothetical protein
VTGYTGPDDGKPLDPRSRKLFPPDRAAGGHQPVEPLGYVEPAPTKTGKRPPRKKAGGSK